MGRLLGTEDGGVKWLPEVKATPLTPRSTDDAYHQLATPAFEDRQAACKTPSLTTTWPCSP